MAMVGQPPHPEPPAPPCPWGWLQLKVFSKMVKKERRKEYQQQYYTYQDLKVIKGIGDHRAQVQYSILHFITCFNFAL